MKNTRRGFFVPGSVSGEYVANQKTEQGAYQWDKAVGEVGLGQQAALSTLNKEYSTTISNAYTNYLAASRGVAGSNMGEGYKEAYRQSIEEGLAAGIAETNMTAGQARLDIAQQGANQMQGIQGLFESEVANRERVATTAQDYLTYLGNLETTVTTGHDKKGKPITMQQKFLDEEQRKQSIDTMYETVFGAQPRGYTDDFGNVGMTYQEWLRQSLKDNETDRAWDKWFKQGGFEGFRQSVKKGVKPL